MCFSVGGLCECCHVCAAARGSQKRASEPLELEFEVEESPWCGCGKLNTEPLAAQEELCTPEPYLQPVSDTHVKIFARIY